jgi:hypothetical protein
MEYGPLKIIVNDTTVPQAGYFSVEEPINWQKCRETFADRFTSNISGFYFSHAPEPKVSDAVYKFILRTEDVLRVGGINLNPTKISKTNRNFAIWVEPSMFWKDCEFKRSLLTIFLRCGTEYRDEDYEKALFSQIYIKDTTPAVKRFLFGFTQYNKLEVNPKGWVNAFMNKTKDDVKTILTKPYGLVNENNFFGVGSLWS